MNHVYIIKFNIYKFIFVSEFKTKSGGLTNEYSLFARNINYRMALRMLLVTTLVIIGSHLFLGCGVTPGESASTTVRENVTVSEQSPGIV